MCRRSHSIPVCMLGLLPLVAGLSSKELGAVNVDPVARYDVVWTTPSRDSSGSMPIGNGDIGLNVWVEQNGDLLFYISKTDAWSANTRLLKLGRVRVHLEPNPFRDGVPFRQTLRLETGEIAIHAGAPGSEVNLLVWVDANRPVIRVEAEGQRALEMTASVEIWRDKERALTGGEVISAYGMDGSPQPVTEGPDTVAPTADGRVVWYHRNETSAWPGIMELQGLKPLTAKHTDPLLHRTFGAAMLGEGLVKQGDRSLKSDHARTRHVLSVFPLTSQTDTAAEWLSALATLRKAVGGVGLEQARAAHREWWKSFWERSYIRVSGQLGGGGITANDLPLRIGADSEGANLYHGLISAARVYSRPLSQGEIATLAADRAAVSRPQTGLVGDWRLGELADGAVPDHAGGGVTARVHGETGVAEADGTRGARFGGNGWVEAPSSSRLRLTDSCTLEAWVCPDALPSGGARIIDKSRAGTADGYLLDTFPGNSLRLITEAGTLKYDAKLPVGKWSHVAAVHDGATGVQTLYVDGKAVATQQFGASAETVSRGYALQRLINACAGRGASPIKFNGSIFTVDPREPGETWDADYRRWGSPYWFQNTRLPYWAMLAAGDFDTMQPLFRMYHEALPLAQERTEAYFGHEGAFFPETMHFWGTYANSNYGWDRAGKPISQVDNTYIRWYWCGGLELSLMMLEYRAHTGDDALARSTLVPLADAIVTFYDRHYKRDASGKLRLQPAQALETWQDVVNPLPDIAGLKVVLDELLGLPRGLTTAAQRTKWERIRGELPPLPITTDGGKSYLRPAGEILGAKANMENPELYAVFPFRLFGVGKSGLDIGRLTFERREVKMTGGWTQDSIQAALLGLGSEAAQMVSHNFGNANPGSRFPAFWGPNFDWVPDQDHGNVPMIALQAMLMQTDGAKIMLLPAWPRGWDAEFRLHAPGQTTVEGVVKAGKLQSLKVTPESRRKDVVVMTSH